MAKKSEGFAYKKVNDLLDNLIEILRNAFKFTINSLYNFFDGIYEVRDKSKDLIQTNILVAETHLKNNNIFDANLRYNIVLKLDKHNFKALYGLGYIFYLKKQYHKSFMYFQNAIYNAQNHEQRRQVARFLKKIQEKCR